MAELRWTAEAETSLEEIYRHIARNRPATARRTLESILHKVESLRQAALGRRYPHSGGEVRRFTYGRFQIAYLLDGDEVVVLGVFHGLIFLPLK